MDRQAEVRRLPLARGEWKTVIWGLVVLAVMVLGQAGTYPEPAIFVLAAVLLLVAGALALRSHVIAKRTPTGLRLDPWGMSGYVLEAPVAWQNIAAAEVVPFGLDGERVALALRDPGAYEGPTRDLVHASDRQGTRTYHVVIGAGLALTAPGLLRIIEDWHGRYGEKGDA